jgi:hypothetical protein
MSFTIKSGRLATRSSQKILKVGAVDDDENAATASGEGVQSGSNSNPVGRHAPTNIILSSNAIREHLSINSTVGTLQAEDIDTSETYSYSLAAGAGDSDNGSFNISGNSLRSSSVFDYATKSAYSIRVRVSDGELSFEKAFAITITSVSPQSYPAIELPRTLVASAPGELVDKIVV